MKALEKKNNNNSIPCSSGLSHKIAKTFTVKVTRDFDMCISDKQNLRWDQIR